MNFAQLQAKLATMLGPLNEGVWSGRPGCYTFRDFVNRVYLPWQRRFWRESTATSSEYLIKRHLLSPFGAVPLGALSLKQMQRFLDEKSRMLSRSTVGHLRWFLNAIFKLAVGEGVIGYNPASCLRIPRYDWSPEKERSLTQVELKTYLDVLPPREQLIARLAVFEGLRAGEILALRWNDLNGENLRIDETVYRGIFERPQNRKARFVPLSTGSLAGIRQLAAGATEVRPEGLLFPSEGTAIPIALDSLWRRHMKPALAVVGLEWATLQVLRKAKAILMSGLHQPPRDRE